MGEAEEWQNIGPIATEELMADFPMIAYDNDKDDWHASLAPLWSDVGAAEEEASSA